MLTGSMLSTGGATARAAGFSALFLSGGVMAWMSAGLTVGFLRLRKANATADQLSGLPDSPS
jgi:hypothetical protein